MSDETIIQSGNAQAVVRQPGAQLISWCTEPGKEQIFLSKASSSESHKPLRGGVPVIFPQFGKLGDIKRHGFARDLDWQLASIEPGRAVFKFRDSESTRQYWDYSFQCKLEITCDTTQLQMKLSVDNSGGQLFSFCAALHTYLRVEDLTLCRLRGIQGCDYWDNGTDFNNRHTEQTDELRFSDAIDRVYFNTPDHLELTEPSKVREIKSAGFTDTVVWNPGVSASRTMSDMEDNEFTQMLCIESAVIDKPVELAPGKSWSGSQSIRVLK